MRGLILKKQILQIFLILGLFLCQKISFAQDSLEHNTMYQRVMDLTEAVDDPDRQVGEFDPSRSASLPIGLVKTISETQYVIAIDSAYFLNDAAYFSAYMAIEFPGADRKIAFAAKDIQFNPEGVVGGDLAKLMLVSDHMIEMGPNTKLELKGDGSNYVNWNCNGFQSVNLHGSFLFSGNLLEPANEDTCVSAEFTVNVQDVNNMLTTVSFSPFSVSGLDDFDFSVSNAYVDMSDYVNPVGVTMPTCYNEMYPEDISLWRGFFLENFTVTLPRSISDDEVRTTLYARNMFIDDAGVTGYLGASNVLSLNQGETDGGWGFSVDSLELGLTTNELTSGLMTGNMQVPLMDNNSLEYVAAVTKSERGSAIYNFGINAEESMDVSCFSSTIELFPTTRLDMTIKDEKFSPQLTLNGDWTLDRENAQLRGMAFQELVVITEAPYVSSGLFSLVQGEPESGEEAEDPNELATFGISIDHLSLGVYQGQPTIATEVGLNFTNTGGDEEGADGGTNISVGGGFRITADVSRNAITDKQEWEIDKFSVTTIVFDVSVNAFAMDGFVDFRQDDPIYGDGFAGAINISIGDVISEIGMWCVFGKLPTYKYFAVDVTAPTNIALGTTGISIVQLSGGLSYRMENTQTVDDLVNSVTGVIDSLVDQMAEYYIPNEDMGVGFRAGVGYQNVASEKTLNGEVSFAIAFNANGGLETITLMGSAFMMAKKSERATATNVVSGTVVIAYDNVEHILDTRLTAAARFEHALFADIWSQIYISPDLWFFHLGTPSVPCSVNLLNFATATAYLMFGQDLPPMPAPPPQVAGVLGGMLDGRNEDAIALGDGIGTGMSLNVGFDQSLAWNAFSVYANGSIGAGFDMTFYKYAPTAYCSETGDEFGANSWYLQGQLYAYGGINAGVAGNFAGSPFDFTVISASMAMLLQGKMPKPVYVYGGLYLEATLFGLFNLDLTLDFDAGEDCTIID
ncbi:MAG: hypothetical protein GQ574_17930 [Crocinitomix sp.]|nr:hypothetical protein [Crocinitomix sp.]